MIVRSLGSVFAALLVISAATIASAEGPQGPDWSRPGWYVGINATFDDEFFRRDIYRNTGGSILVDDGFGLNARVGYRLSSWLAIEGMYEWAHNFDSQLPIASPPVFTVSNHNMIANAKFVWPDWRIQPYVILGIGAQYSIFDLPAGLQLNEWQFVGRPGFGFDLYLTENWVLNGEVAGMLATSNLLGLNKLFYLSVGGGLSYRF